ncbi:MAG: YciI family protein, partial [Actinomycetota bacterium]
MMNGGIRPPFTKEGSMAKYLLSLHNVEGEARPPMTDEEMQQSWKEMQALNAEIRSAGAWVFGGALHGPETATVVKDAGGDVLTTDGPFVESKEHLAGFYIVEAADLDEALTWASKTATCVGKPIEVRPFRDGDA